MQNTHAWFGGEQHTLWKLADVQEEMQNEDGLVDPQYSNSVLQFSCTGADLTSKLEKLEKATT